MGSSSAQPVCSVTSDALSKTTNNTLPSGIGIQLTGKTTSIGQTIGALSHSPSLTMPVSIKGTSYSTAATTTGLVPYTTVITATSCSTQLDSHSSLTTSSPLHGTPLVSVISQTSCSKSTALTSLTGNKNKKDFGILAGTSSNSFPAEVAIATVGSSAQMQIPVPNTKSLYFKSSVHEENTSLLSSQLASNKTQTTFSTPSNYAPVTTSTAGTVQQRIILNTSTQLTAGTQIFLNNSRFVVPPQGLGPGSHVLFISNPAPQVPTTTPVSTRSPLAPKDASPVNVIPRASVLSQSTARLPSVPAVSSPFVACAPAVCPSLMGSTSHAMPFRLTGTPGLGSTLIPSKTNVSALPRFPFGHTGNFGLSPVCTPTLVSSSPRLDSVPSIVSPVKTSAPAFVSAPATIRIGAGTVTQAKSASTLSSATSTALPKLSGSLSSLPVLPSLSTGALCSPVIPVSVPHSSAAASKVTDTPALHNYLPGQQMLAVTTTESSIQPKQTKVKVAKLSTVYPQGSEQTGLENTSHKEQMPVMQAVLSGTRTQVLPTMAVPPITSAASRMQALSNATVPHVGSTVGTFEVAPAIPSSAQAIASETQKNIINPPVILTNTVLRNDFVQTSALDMDASVLSKLLISPDGAVLNTDQCQVNSAELTDCPSPLNALVVSSNGSSGALQTHDSTLHSP
ncbi:uncharacterized protein PB18E9.04c [Nematolebias whitei]|uniref:uncharacterized protein PB18E9.04c n=1 Tax=Nematolebias whitei TaxID=451745 RepID=UPI001898C04A|nr:uncharacterized protein PB18E9.04c [Nematolebias whitei]